MKAWNHREYQSINMKTWNRREYQNSKCSSETDEQLLSAILKARYCNVNHVNAILNHLPTDICIIYEYTNGEYAGGCDHFNLRWLKEWLKINRPNLLDRLDKLMVLK